MAPPSSPLDEPTRRRLARVLEEEAGWAPEATAGLVTAEEAVCALVQGLFAPQITPRLLPAVDNRVTVLLGGGAGAGAGGRCVGRVLFGTEEDGDDDRPIFPRLSHAVKTKLLDLLARALRTNLHSVVRFCQACPCPPPPPPPGCDPRQRRRARRRFGEPAPGVAATITAAVSSPATARSRKRRRAWADEGSGGDGGASLLRRLVDLFLLVEGQEAEGEGVEEEENVLEVCRLVLRLIGVVGTAGVEAKDLKRLLQLLRIQPLPAAAGAADGLDGEEEGWREERCRRRRRLRLVAPILEAIRTLVGRPEDGDGPGPLPTAPTTTGGSSSSNSKAQPPSFFSLGGGAHSGLIVPRIPAWPFPAAYQFLGWFRIERFPPTRRERARAQEEEALLARGLSSGISAGSSSGGSAPAPLLRRASSVSSGGGGGGGGGGSGGGGGGGRRQLHEDEQRAHLFAFLTDEGHGVDVFLADDTLWVEVRDRSKSRGGAEVVEAIPIEGVALRTRTWYFLDVQHIRSRVPAFLGKGDTLTVQVDHQPVFKGHVRFPKDVAGPLARCAIGEGFDGQLAPVYVLREPLSPAVTLQLARAAAGSTPLAAGAHRNANAAIDLEPQAHLPGVSSRRAFASKVLLVYHPDRCRSHMCLDLHGGCHGRVVVDTAGGGGAGSSTGVWGLDHARDVLASIGGVAALFPLFFLLLAAPPAAPQPPHPAHDDSSSSSGGDGEWPILALLLSILARALRGHEANQQELHRIDGPALLEHAIRRTPPRHLLLPRGGGGGGGASSSNERIQRCVGALMDLCTAAAQGHPALEAAMVGRLLGPGLWAHAPLEFQIELQRQLGGFVRRHLGRARQALSVAGLLDAIREHFLPPRPRGPAGQCASADYGEGEEGEEGQGRPRPGWEGNPSLIRMFRHHSFSRPRLGVGGGGGSSSSGVQATTAGTAGAPLPLLLPEPGLGAVEGAAGATAVEGNDEEGEEDRDRGVLRRTVLHTVMLLCQDEVTPPALRPLAQFLAAFGGAGSSGGGSSGINSGGEAVVAEEVLQLLLFWLQQDPPPPGLLDAIRALFGTPQAFVAFVVLAAVNRGGPTAPDALRATGLRVLVAYLMRLDSAPPPSASSGLLAAAAHGAGSGHHGHSNSNASVALVPASPTLTGASSTAASGGSSAAASSPVLGAWDDGGGAGVGAGGVGVGSASTSKLALPTSRMASLSMATASRSARALSSSSTLSLSLSTRGSAALGLGFSAGAGGSSSSSGANGSNGIPAGDYAFAASTGPIDRQLLHPQHGGGGAVVGFLLHYLLQHARDTGEATYAALLEAVLATRGTLGRLPMFSRPSLSGACMAPSRLQPTRVMDDADELRNVMVLTVLLKLLPALGAPLKERAFGDLLLLLKYSEQNRMAFVTVAGWQVPLFEMMAPFLLPWTAPASTTTAPSHSPPPPQGGGAPSPSPGPPGPLADIYYDPALPPSAYNLLAPRPRTDGGRRAESEAAAVEGGEEDEAARRERARRERQRRREGVMTDHWVDTGLRLYVLLLVHVLQRPGGWQEVARALSLASTTATHTAAAHDGAEAPPVPEAAAGSGGGGGTDAAAGASTCSAASPGRLLLFALLVQLFGEAQADLKGRIARQRARLLRLQQRLAGEQEGFPVADPPPSSAGVGVGGGDDDEAAVALPPVYLANLTHALFLAAAFLLEEEEEEEEEGEGEGSERSEGVRPSPVTLSVLGLRLEEGEEGEESEPIRSSRPGRPATGGGGNGNGVAVAAGTGGSDGEWRRFCEGSGRAWLRYYPPFAPAFPSSSSTTTPTASAPSASPPPMAMPAPSGGDGPGAMGTGVKGRRVCAATAGRALAMGLLQVLDALWMLLSLSAATDTAAAAAAATAAPADGRRRGSSGARLGVSLGSSSGGSAARAASPLAGSFSPRGGGGGGAAVAMITPQTLEFLSQDGPALLIGGGGGGGGSGGDGNGAGSVALLMLRLSLLVLASAHPLHPYATANVYRLKRLSRVLSVLLAQARARTGPVGFFAFGASSAAAAQAQQQAALLGDWLLVLLAHAQAALRRLRALLLGTLAHTPPSSPCPFCAGSGPLEPLLRQAEDLLDVAEALHREHGPLLKEAMPPRAHAHFAVLLQARAAQYAAVQRRREQQQHRRRRSGRGPTSPLPPSPSSPPREQEQQQHEGRCPSCFAHVVGCGGDDDGRGRQQQQPAVPLPEGSEALPWRAVWLLSPWLAAEEEEEEGNSSNGAMTPAAAVATADSPVLGRAPAVRRAARQLLGREAAWGERVRYYRAFCLEQQWVEERLWRAVDPRAAMFLEGRALRAQLEEAEHQRLAGRAAARDVGERRAIGGWAGVMRAHSAEWSAWAVEDEKSRWKISTHSDVYHRRMLLTRTDKFDDHQGAAYQSGAMAPDRVPSTTAGPEGAEAGQDEGAERLLAAKRRRGTRADVEEEEAGGGGDAAVAVGTPSASSMKLPWAEEFAAGEAWITTQAAIVVNAYGSVQGRVLLTTQSLYFHPDRHLLPPAKGEREEEGGEEDGTGKEAGGGTVAKGQARRRKRGAFAYQWKDKKWRLNRVTEVHGRRFLLRNCALEVYFSDAHEVFLAFPTPKDRATFFAKLSRQHMPLLATPKLLRPAEILRESGFTELWRRRQMSNFEYLMRLNIIAGRSYNDINQYPVFPWVLADYESPTLDLADPATFRDLRKPIGALDPDRLRVFLDRFAALEGEEHPPPFMYGSHYSSAALVLHYLLRQEPYATLAVRLQSGTFDCPDRLFFSLAAAWRGCHRSPTDVKELVPELFAVPEVLLNSNRYPLGRLEEGEGPVDDVRLPPWAKGSAHEFVRLHRLALESEHVSQRLHHWIDLVFGDKQRGPASVAANNVFYYLTYEGSVDIDAIDDPVLREATEAQIKHYGQTPAQLLTKPHPPRLPLEECIRPLCADLASLPNLRAYTPDHQLLGLAPPSPADDGGGDDGATAATGTTEPTATTAAAAAATTERAAPVLSVAVLPGSGGGRLLVVFADLLVATYRWSAMPDAHDFPFTVRPERARELPCQASSMSSYAIFDSAACARPWPPPLSPRAPASPPSACRGADPLSPPSAEEAVEAAGGGFVDVRGEGGVDPRRRSSPSPRRRGLRGAGEDEALLLDGGVGGLGLEDDEEDEDEEGEQEDSILGGDAVGGSMGPWNFALAAGHRLICCGFWDHAVKCYALHDGLRPLQTGGNGGHRGAVNCVQVGADGRTLVTAGQDGTCRVWVVADQHDIAAALRSDSAYLASASASTGAGASASAAASGGVGAGAAGAAGSGGGGAGSAGSPLLGRRGSAAAAAVAAIRAGGGDGLGTGKALGAGGLSLEGMGAAAAAALSMAGASGGGGGGGGGDAGVPAGADEGKGLTASVQAGTGTGSAASVAAVGGSGGAGGPSSSSSSSALSGQGAQAPLQCVAILWGHDTAVLSLSLCTELDLLASGSTDGAIVLHRVRKGKYVRRVAYPGQLPVHLLQLCPETGNMVAHSWADRSLHAFSLNGHPLARVPHLPERLYALAATADGALLLTGGQRGVVGIHRVHSLEQIHEVRIGNGPIRCLSFTPDHQYLLVGSENGRFSVVADPLSRLQMLHRVLSRTFFGVI